jgi:hypothetical protein
MLNRDVFEEIIKDNGNTHRLSAKENFLYECIQCLYEMILELENPCADDEDTPFDTATEEDMYDFD